MAVSKRLRYEVFRRDNHTCQYCGASAPEVELTIDHVVPRVLGGSDTDPANLTTACRPCNSGKTSASPDAPLVAGVAQDALRWAAAIKQAQTAMLADLDARAREHAQFEEWWDGWRCGDELIPKDAAWWVSVDQLRSAGLPMAVLRSCIEIAMGHRKVTPERTFRYMCGIAWNRVKELQDSARALAGGNPLPARTELPDPFDEGRADAAGEILGELPDTEREQYVEWADDGGWGAAHGEPQTNADRLVGAAGMAINDINSDFHHLQQILVKTLGDMPGREGERAMRTASRALYERFGADFSRMNFLNMALQHLDDELRYPEAETYLGSLPNEESAEWIAFALSLYDSSYLSDKGIAVRAARCARTVADGSMFTAMCCGAGQHIKACSQRATHYALLDGAECCSVGFTDDHIGHQVCEPHLQQLMDGTFISAARGRTYAATDWHEISTADTEVPF